MDEFELDEGALYGAEDSGLRSGLDEGVGVEFQGGVLNDSDDESNTVVDLGDSIHGGPYTTPSREFAGIAPIPGSRALRPLPHHPLDTDTGTLSFACRPWPLQT